MDTLREFVSLVIQYFVRLRRSFYEHYLKCNGKNVDVKQTRNCHHGMYCNYCIHWDTISFSICKKSHYGYTQVNIRAHMMEDEARADKELTAKMPDNLLLH